MTSFQACGDGVYVKYHGKSHIDHISHWWEIRKWCAEQGWEHEVDVFIPAMVPDGRWYFSDIDKQNWFILKWS